MPNTIRWAINIHRWTPGREEWCAAMRRVQTQGKERARIREFKYFHDAKASLAGRLLLRLLWFRCCGGAEGQGDAVFSRSSKGRPRLENCSWDFNVSHQGSFVVLAAEKDDLGGEQPVQVGVDVMRTSEQQRDLKRFFSLMNRQFTPEEWETIRKGDEGEAEVTTEESQLRMFYRHWCLKESFIKADGQGLSWNLLRLNFVISTLKLPLRGVVQDSVLLVDGEEREGWRFQECLLDGEHCASVALNLEKEGRSFQVLPSVARIVSELPELPADLSEDEEWSVARNMDPVKPF